MAVEVTTCERHFAECVSCHSNAGPISTVRAGFDPGDGSISWTVIRLCPKCRVDLSKAMYPDAETYAEDEAYSLTHATVIMGVMHGIIEELRDALGGVVKAFRTCDPIDVGKLESVLETTQRRLTGNITDIVG